MGRRASVVLVAALLVAGAAAARAAGDPRRCAPASEQRMGDGERAFVALVPRGARAFARPGGRVMRRFGPIGVNGAPQVFAVLGRVVNAECATRWVHVQLPVRPNGANGYVHVFAVRLVSVRTRIVVDLVRRRLMLLRRGRIVLRTPVAIGTAATPTPKGRFYVKEALLTGDPRSAFGPGALGLSSYSPVLTGWAQGGPIGIHGTDDPASIGHARSNGCIRVPNAIASRLLAVVPLGTPVIVR
jgi:lipoprotein-anchoring transpeptidase ErfK/SrfK